MNFNCEDFSDYLQPFLFLGTHAARSCGLLFSYKSLGDESHVETSRNKL